MKNVRWVQVFGMTFVIGLLIIFVINLNIQADVVTIGDKAADFELEDPGGEMHQLSDYKDKPVVLYFFTTWCTSCKQQTPDMIDFKEAYEDDVHVLTIVRSESKRAVERYVEETGHTENQYLFDFNTEVSDRYGVMGQPETIIIDAGGTVVDHNIGPLTKEVLADKMSAFLH